MVRVRACGVIVEFSADDTVPIGLTKDLLPLKIGLGLGFQKIWEVGLVLRLRLSLGFRV